MTALKNRRKIKRFTVLAVIAAMTYFPHDAMSQNGIDALLSSVSANNKTIKVSQQYWEARKLEYRIGLNPSNPTVEYDYMKGYPSTAGNQVDFTVTQGIDFPTAYIRKRQLADMQSSFGDNMLIRTRQNILLEAKQEGLHLIYLNKRKALLTYRYKIADSLQRVYTIRLEKGDGNILDVNKARIQALNAQSDLQLLEGDISQVLQKLTELNGGIPVVLTDTIYPSVPTLPSFETLESTIEAGDPVLKSLHAEQQIQDKRTELSRALALPRFEAGYHSQAILGQSFRGVHFGVSIPLWEHRNTVKLSQAESSVIGYRTEEHRTEHYYEIKQLYERYLALQKSLNDYSATLNTMNSGELLGKALRLGQISTIEYFLELSYYNETYDRYLQLEKEYHDVIAQLHKYTL